jgi:hypothetical protein
MASTSFSLAPPAKTVDGLLAVPIDIRRVTARLVFDGATSSGEGDATMEFVAGPQDGNPIFDLRQTITGAWLDGIALPVSKLAHHDFGGGTDAQLRVIESILAAGSSHSLRVTYTVGVPQASMAGSYLPAITWSAGPRLAFNFGFTDLGAGRYLEAWVPANLIFDQFELSLDLELLNSPVAHTVITNGTVTSLGANHWRVDFPARFTALSTLLELRATDTLASASDTTTLPVSGITVTIEAWKLAASPINLAVQLNNLKGWLVDDENAAGRYIHDGRFVAFLYQGGMEYEGGTTSSPGSLRHETFHSWWARGLKPASQPDAWWDEAWTVYNDNGASLSFPFDYADPPQELCPRNPWVRITAPGSYVAGNDFWEGVASLLGVANLRGWMREFYNERCHRPATTTEIEEFLVCRSGNPQLVDAFHRFVFGFPDPSPPPDLWMRDDPAHAGEELWAGAFWDSPDLWVRNADDGGTTHQSPEYGQDNWFYATVRNKGTAGMARHFLVTFNVKSYAGFEFVYPGDFLPCMAAASGFELGPGQSAVVKARWPATLVPPAGTHGCLLASVLTRSDQPASGGHVWEHNNLAQKNLTIVDLVAGDWMVLPFVVANRLSRATRRLDLELVQPRRQLLLEASLMHDSAEVFRLPGRRKPKLYSNPLPDSVSMELEGADCGAPVSGSLLARARNFGRIISSAEAGALAMRFQKGAEAAFVSANVARIPIAVRSQEQRVLGLRLRVPPEAKVGMVLRSDLVLRDPGRKPLGGLAVEIRVRDRRAAALVGGLKT